jgi:hypothetical protein
MLVDLKYKGIKVEVCTELTEAPVNVTGLKRRLRNNETFEFVSIKEFDDNTSQIIMPCGIPLVDELGHIYKVDSQYVENCSEPRAFQYLTALTVRSDSKCGSDPATPKNWRTEVPIYGSHEHVTKSELLGWPCKAFEYRYHWKSLVRCETEAEPRQLKLCNWYDTGSSSNFSIDGEVMGAVITIEQSPVVSYPYGYWVDGSQIFIRTATENFLEGTNYNYSCDSYLATPSYGQEWRYPEAKTVNPNPYLISCKMIVNLPYKIVDSAADYCTHVQVVSNEEGAYGLLSDIGNCAIGTILVVVRISLLMGK